MQLSCNTCSTHSKGWHAMCIFCVQQCVNNMCGDAVKHSLFCSHLQLKKASRDCIYLVCTWPIVRSSHCWRCTQPHCMCKSAVGRASQSYLNSHACAFCCLRCMQPLACVSVCLASRTTTMCICALFHSRHRTQPLICVSMPAWHTPGVVLEQPRQSVEAAARSIPGAHQETCTQSTRGCLGRCPQTYRHWEHSVVSGPTAL